ncbi:MAG: HD domain-containing protein [Deltaproteobacteria bacterium]|nr:HD domain-containing protein [Deltaproteobacteria bacterium]
MTQSEYQRVFKAADAARKKYEGHDAYTGQHSVRVAHYAVLLASRIPGYGTNEIRRLEITAMLHDYGKTFIDPRVIKKEGPLDDAEWVEMKRHPELGVQGLQSKLDALGGLVMPLGILWHHKLFDGGGYPDGRIAGMAIPLEARVIAVADVFDALTSKRAYRKDKPAFTPDEAIGMMREGAGRQLDPSLVDLFASVHQAESDRVGGRAGARTMQISSVIGVEVERARSILRSLVGPFDPGHPLRNVKASADEVLGRLVAELLRANLDLRSAENVARYALRMPLHETFRPEDVDGDPILPGLSDLPRHHVEVTLRLRKMPPRLSYMHVVAWRGELWLSVSEQRGEGIEVRLAR